jgi:hypothetical protein
VTEASFAIDNHVINAFPPDRPDQPLRISILPRWGRRPITDSYGANTSSKQPPSQGWRTFLRHHADSIAAMDLFMAPTISFRLPYGLLMCGMIDAGFCSSGRGAEQLGN